MMTHALVDPRTLVEMPGNETVMDDTTFESLVRFIGEKGFKDPVLCWRRRKLPLDKGGEELVIIDGVHRKDAAIRNALGEVPVDIDEDVHDEATALAMRIGMNRHKGDQDLAAVGRSFLDLAAAGWPAADMTVVGFTLDEVESLMRAAQGSLAPDQLGESSAPPLPPDVPAAEAPTRTYPLKINFESKAARDVALHKLETIASGDTLAEALTAALEAWETKGGE